MSDDFGGDEPATWGLYDTLGRRWLGPFAGPSLFDVKAEARFAARTVGGELGWPADRLYPRRFPAAEVGRTTFDIFRDSSFVGEENLDSAAVSRLVSNPPERLWSSFTIPS